MGFSRKTMHQIIELMLLAAALVLVIFYSERVAAGIGLLFSILRPFLMGFAIAFVLNLPLRLLENTVFKKWNSGARRPVCLLLSVVLVVLVVALVIVLVVPQLVTAVGEIAQQIPVALDRLVDWLTVLSREYPELNDPTVYLAQLETNWESIVESVANFLKNGLGNVVTTTIDFASSAVGAVANGFIALIFSFYVLSQKEKLADQVRRTLRAYLPQKACDWVLKVCALMYKNFSSFITGQCIEAVILGTMFVVAMTIFRMPYAVMVGVLIAFTALIPIVGAFIGCAVGAFLILLENPMQAVAFVVLFLVLQQIEGNLIYPRVVGSSVGLPSIWVLTAVTVGGSLFGVAGMLLFIPLVSTVYALLRDDVNARNAEKAQGSGEKEKPAALPKASPSEM